MMEWFICPDKQIVPVKDCLSSCRMDERCLTLPTLHSISEERVWAGQPSTTQLLNGTMMEYLKLTVPYAIDPDSRAFALLGSTHHHWLSDMAKKLSLPSEIAMTIDRDIFDLLEPGEDSVVGNETWILTDYKTWGSYRVAKALGMVEVGKQPDPSGERYKSSGKWGKAGDPKMVPIFQRDAGRVDLWETELQLNRYRIMLEERGIRISRMQIQITVRDGGLQVAHGRGIARNMYMVPIRRLDDGYVISYFEHKRDVLLECLEQHHPPASPCDVRESWEGARCKGYCDVSFSCPKGMLYAKEAK